jgi:hypothetical protein
MRATGGARAGLRSVGYMARENRRQQVNRDAEPLVRDREARAVFPTSAESLIGAMRAWAFSSATLRIARADVSRVVKRLSNSTAPGIGMEG